MTFMRPGGHPWFNPSSDDDIALTTYSLAQPQMIMEYDELEVLCGYVDELSKLGGPGTGAPQGRFLVFQHWGPWANGSRPFMALMEPRAKLLGEAIHKSNFSKVMLIVTTFMKGSLRTLADSIDKKLEYLGLLWYFSGDDITDETYFTDDIGYLAKKLQLERLTIMTGAFNGEVEKRLAQALEQAPDLRIVQVHDKQENGLYPRLATPNIDAMLQRRER